MNNRYDGSSFKEFFEDFRTILHENNIGITHSRDIDHIRFLDPIMTLRRITAGSLSPRMIGRVDVDDNLIPPVKITKFISDLDNLACKHSCYVEIYSSENDLIINIQRKENYLKYYPSTNFVAGGKIDSNLKITHIRVDR